MNYGDRITVATDVLVCEGSRCRSYRSSSKNSPEQYNLFRKKHPVSVHKSKPSVIRGVIVKKLIISRHTYRNAALN